MDITSPIAYVVEQIPPDALVDGELLHDTWLALDKRLREHVEHAGRKVADVPTQTMWATPDGWTMLKLSCWTKPQ